MPNDPLIPQLPIQQMPSLATGEPSESTPMVQSQTVPIARPEPAPDVSAANFSMDVAKTSNPAEEGKLVDLSAKSGMPVNLLRNLPPDDLKAITDDPTPFLEAGSKTTKFLSDPQNAAVAQGQERYLYAMEKAFEPPVFSEHPLDYLFHYSPMGYAARLATRGYTEVAQPIATKLGPLAGKTWDQMKRGAAMALTNTPDAMGDFTPDQEGVRKDFAKELTSAPEAITGHDADYLYAQKSLAVLAGHEDPALDAEITRVQAIVTQHEADSAAMAARSPVASAVSTAADFGIFGLEMIPNMLMGAGAGALYSGLVGGPASALIGSEVGAGVDIHLRNVGMLYRQLITPAPGEEPVDPKLAALGAQIGGALNTAWMLGGLKLIGGIAGKTAAGKALMGEGFANKFRQAILNPEVKQKLMALVGEAAKANAKGATVAGVVMAGATLINQATESAVKGENKFNKGQVWESLLGGIVGAGTLGLPMSVMGVALETHRQVQDAQLWRDKVVNLHDQVHVGEGAELKARSVTTMGKFLQDLGGDVYLDGEDAWTLNQESPDTLAKLGLTPEVINNAKAFGNAVKVPMRDAIMELDKGEFEKIADIAKPSPMALSSADADRYNTPEGQKHIISILEQAAASAEPLKNEMALLGEKLRSDPLKRLSEETIKQLLSSVEGAAYRWGVRGVPLEHWPSKLNKLNMSGESAPAKEGQTDTSPEEPMPVEMPKTPEAKAALRVVEMDPAEITADPERFQFKTTGQNAAGVGTELKKVSVWNEEHAGVLLTWKDPENGKTYIINGHHRLDLAKRLGVKSVDVRYAKAQTAKGAKAAGALANIAENRGTPYDVAVFLREHGIDAAAMETTGNSLESPVGAQGLALAGLSDDIFKKYERGDLPMTQAIAIGEGLPNHADQKALVEQIDKSKRKISGETLKELIRQAKEAPRVKGVEHTLFGDFETEENTALEKAELSAHIKERLGKDRRLFGFVSRGDRAEALKAGGNVIDAEKSGGIARSAAEMEGVYTILSNMTGPISTALNESAVKLKQNPKNRKEIQESLYGKIKSGIASELSRGEGFNQGRASQAGAPATLEQADLAEVVNRFEQSQKSGDVTENPAFRAWFGDSKVVDEATGKPLVVYHGTGAKFKAFNTQDESAKFTTFPEAFGSWFAEKPELVGKIHEKRSEEAAYSGKKYKPQTLETFLSLKNPLIVESRKDLDRIVPSGKTTADVKKELIAKGYDGIEVKDDYGHGRSFVAFDPTQIKSATANRGTFDPTKPSILEQFAAPIDKLGFLSPHLKEVMDGNWEKMPAKELAEKLGANKNPMPWDMTKAQFDAEEAKGMGVTWNNAVQTGSGNIKLSGTREHGDMIASLEEGGAEGPFVRGWTWGKDKNTFISVYDVDRAPDSSFYETYKMVAREKGIDAQNPIASFLAQKGDQLVTKDEIRPFLYQKEGVVKGNTEILPEGYVINIFKEGDLSTILHEFSHVYLLELQQWMVRGGGTKEMAKDWATLTKWLGTDLTKDNSDIKAHEKFARGMEKYFREGVAPSENLQPAFTHFASYLTQIYKRAKDVDAAAGQEIKLDPSVRRVFDRLYALDEEIEASASRNNLAFTEEEFAKMGASQEDKDYLRRLLDNAKTAGKDALQKRRDKAIKGKTKAWGIEAAFTAEEERVYQTEKSLRAEPLDRAMMEAEMGKTIADALKAKYPRLVKKGTGNPAAMAAAEHGYESHSEMINELLNSPKKEEWIQNFIDQKRAEAESQYSADEAYMGTEEAQTYLDTVANHIAKKISPNRVVRIQDKLIHSRAIKAVAEKQLAGMPVNEALRVDIHLSNFKMAMRKTKDSVATGDRVDPKTGQAGWQKALEHNAQARLHYELVRQSRALATGFEKSRRRSMKALHSKSIEPDFQVALTNTMNVFGMTAKKAEMRTGGMDLKKLLTPETTDDAFTWDAPPAFPETLLDPKPRKWKNLTVSEAQDLFDMLTWLEKTGRNVKEGKLFELKGQQAETATRLTQDMAGLPDYKIKAENTIGRAVQKFFSGYGADMSLLQFILRDADGYRKDGENTTTLFHPLTARTNDKLRHERELMREMDAPIKALVKSGKTFDPSTVGVPVPANMAAQGWNWTWARIVGLALHQGSEYNRNAVLEGYGMTQDQVNTILCQLSTSDTVHIQKIWDVVNSLWPELKMVHEDVNAIVPRKVGADPFSFVTKDGDNKLMRGGYFPIKFDPWLSIRANEWSEKDDIMQSIIAAFPKPSVPAGYMIGRKGAGGLPPTLDFRSVLVRHLDFATTYIHMARILKDVDAVTRNRIYSGAFIQKFGIDRYKQIRPYLSAVAAQQRMPMDAIDKMASFANSMGSMAALSGRVSSQLKQVFDTLHAISETGFRTVANGQMAIAKDPVGTYALITELSPYMESRSRAHHGGVFDAIKDFGDETFWGQTREQASNLLMLGYHVFDYLAAAPLWMGKFKEGMKEHGDTMRAVAAADDVVRATQPGYGPLETPALLRNAGAVKKMFLAFAGWTLKFGNRQMSTMNAYRAGRISAGQLARFGALELFAPALLANVSFKIIRNAFSDQSVMPNADDAKDTAVDTVNSMAGAFPVIGTLVQASTRWMTGIGYGSPFETPALKAASQLYKTGEALTKMMADYDNPDTAKKAMWTMAEGASLVLRLPVTRIYNDWVEGIKQVEQHGGPGHFFLPDPMLRKEK